MPRKKQMKDYYIIKSVSIPHLEYEKLSQTKMGVKENTEFLHFILSRLEKEELPKQGYRKTVGFNLLRNEETKRTLNKVESILKKTNTDMSEVYRKYFFDFEKTLHNSKH